MTTFQNYPIPPQDEPAGPEPRRGPQSRDQGPQPPYLVVALTTTNGQFGADYVIPPPGVPRQEARQALTRVVERGWDDDYDDILRVSDDELLVVRQGVWTGATVTRVVVAEHVATTNGS